MALRWKYHRLSLFWYTYLILAASGIFADELDVYEAILTNYNKNVRPVRNTNGPLVVSIELLYFNLLYMNQNQQSITFQTDVEMIWKDENLRWNASEFGGTSSIVIPSYLLWKPDIYVTTGLSIDYMYPEDQRYISVQSDGTVELLTLFTITNLCRMSIEDFPYDIQTCYISLEPWMYSIDQIDLAVGNKTQNLTATIDDGKFMGNGEWTVVSFHKVLGSYSEFGKPPYVILTYAVELQRQSIYYICVLLIPTFVTATICLFGLFVPAMNTGERVEKVNIGMATLLAMGVILGIVAGEMPKTTTLPLLGFYVLAELVLCTIGVFVSMVIMLAHQRASTRALIPPRWLNTILFLKMETIQKLKKTDVTTVYTEKATKPLSKDKTTNDLIETIKNSIYAKQLNQVLKKVEEYIDDKKFEDLIILQWIIIFDRIDMFFLIVFNTVNVIISIFLFK